TVHVHVKDATGTPGNFQFPPLGQGDVDFQGVIAALKETTYQGFLSVEHEADAFGYVETEEAVLRDSLRFVRRLLGSHS
ncbi:MAG: sugar phosphate isomerase/epimerase, partial [Chloroflexota bacterium]